MRAPGGLGRGWREVLDLSGDPVARARYELLASVWWPHPTHAWIAVEVVGDMLVHTCACGETLGIDLDSALAFGVV